jgi:hypothetical protein
VQKAATHTPRKPAPKLIGRTAFSPPPPPPPRRMPNVALHDNQFPQKEKARDIGTKCRTVFDLAAVEPLKAARRCQAEISTMLGGFHDERRRHIAEAYAVARALQNNPRAWENFRKDEFWEQRKKKPSIEDRKAAVAGPGVRLQCHR